MILPGSLPAVAFIAAALVLVPLPAHWRAKNVATVSLVVWFFITNMIYFVNSLAWSNNSAPRLLVWCDIVTKLMIGASSAIPAATLCICKHLELVASGRMVRLTHEDHRRRRIFELLLCWGVPVVLMALHYVVQGHRFDIVEAFGCQPAVYYSIPAVFIIWFPPLLLSVLTLIYSTLALCHFFRQRITFTAHLSGSGSSLNTHRYLRLMAMAVTEIAWGTSLNAVSMYDNIAPGLRPWTNWADVHSDFGRIATYRLFELGPAYVNQMLIIWLAMPISAYIFFVFFAFGEDTKKDYKRVVEWTMRVVLRRTPRSKPMLINSVSSSSASHPHRLIVNKLSTVDVRSDFEDDHALPCYTPSSGHTLYSPTSSKVNSASHSKFDFEKSRSHDESLPSSRFSIISSASDSAASLHSLPRISVSDEFPASRPPSPAVDASRPPVASVQVPNHLPRNATHVIRVDPSDMA